MIGFEKALKIVLEGNPEMKPIGCIELEKYYSFNMVPKNLDENDCFANSCGYLVDKTTGEHRTAHFLEIIAEPILQTIEL